MGGQGIPALGEREVEDEGHGEEAHRSRERLRERAEQRRGHGERGGGEERGEEEPGAGVTRVGLGDLPEVIDRGLQIAGLAAGLLLGWIWMDAVMGIVGGAVIARWSYGLIRDSGAVLLDMTPDPAIAQKIRSILETDGDLRVVGEAEDGRAAIDAVLRHRPDVVLMDVRMPRLDGLAATAALRAREHRPAVVVEAIKLVEGGLAAMCDEVWLVTCEPAAQRERLRVRGLDEATAAERIAAQGDLAERLRPAATRVIDTSGDVAEVRAAITACRDAGLPGRIPHDFRRTAVRNLERAGGPRSTARRLSATRPRRSTGAMRSPTRTCCARVRPSSRHSSRRSAAPSV